VAEIRIVTPDVSVIENAVTALVDHARQYRCVDTASHEAGQHGIAMIARTDRQAVEFLAPAKKATHEAHQAVCQMESRLRMPLGNARRIISHACAQWEREEVRRAEEAARREEDQARQKAEADRAIDAAMAVTPELAEEIASEPILVPVVEPAPALAMVGGVSRRTTWDAEVTDLCALICYAAERIQAGDRGASSMLEASRPTLRRLAISQRDQLSIPGVRAVAKDSHAVRETRKVWGV